MTPVMISPMMAVGEGEPVIARRTLRALAQHSVDDDFAHNHVGNDGKHEELEQIWWHPYAVANRITFELADDAQ